MLQLGRPQDARDLHRTPTDSKENTGAELIDLAFGFLRRRLLLIVAVVLAVVPVGEYLALKLVPPQFAATATIIIDPRKYQIFQHTTMVGDTVIDAAALESQLEILKSENIALEVIRKLNLAEDPEFGHPTPGIGSLLGLAPTGPVSDSDRERRALGVLRKGLTVRRIGPTYVIEITFRSRNAERAAEIANQIGDTYILDQLEGKYDATRRASSWLESRLKELSDQSLDAQRVVVEFKEKNNIVDAGNGRLVPEQQLTELNTQMLPARERAVEAAARLRRVEEILNSDSEDATINSAVADSLKSDVVTKLRSQYLELAHRAVEWSARYGSDHLAVVNLHSQLAQIRSSLRDELRRVAETYKSEYDIAKQREEDLKRDLSRVTAETEKINQARVTLGELESNAKLRRALYDNFLQRYMESIQQETFPITEAKLITKATTPKDRDLRKTLVAMGAVPAGALAIGIAFAFLFELMDRAIRSGKQAEAALRADCLALIPFVEETRKERRLSSKKQSDMNDANARMIARRTGAIWHAINEPFSLFSEAIRSIRLAVDQECDQSCKVIGLTSSLPDEGKSTVAVSLARGIALTGARVILVDGDLCRPSLSALLSPGAHAGFVDVIHDRSSLSDAIWNEPGTGMAFLPAGVNSRLAHSSDILGSVAAKKVFDLLRSKYEYVIVDLSPLAPVVDVRATSHLVDCYLLVIEWGRTTAEMVQRALGHSPAIYERLLGAVLNKTDFKRISGYDATFSQLYGKAYYGGAGPS